MSSRYNKLPRPIAVMGYRSTYMHLCELCGLNPHNNDVFVHVHDYTTAGAQKVLRVLEIEGAKETLDYNAVQSIAMRNVQNETKATQVVRGD